MAGTLRPGDLPRLAGLIARGKGAPDENLDVRVGFSRGPEGYPIVRIRVSGTISLTCQRCLAPMSWPLDLDVALAAVGSDDLADELADPFDSVVLDEEGRLALRMAVEDEILAGLPFAPLHDEGQGCNTAAPLVAAAPEAQSPRPSRPFAGLAELMRRDGGDRDN